MLTTIARSRTHGRYVTTEAPINLGIGTFTGTARQGARTAGNYISTVRKLDMTGSYVTPTHNAPIPPRSIRTRHHTGTNTQPIRTPGIA